MTVEQRTKLGELVIQRIETLGISQVAYADRMGVKKNTLHNVLTGKSELPEEPFRRLLAEDLGITVLDIFLMAGELQPEDIPGAVDATVRPDRVAALCRMVASVDWAFGDRYEHMTETLQGMQDRDRARQAAPAPAPPSDGRDS